MNDLQQKRLLSLDVFRGITITLMILVNAQGSRLPYTFLDHAKWHGGTLADLVFPFFLFIVGATSVLVLGRQKDGVKKSSLYRSILVRSLSLLALGLILNSFPKHFDASLRFYGILQRIAVCYCIGAMIYLSTSVKTQIFIFLSLLWLYWFIMTQIPVPGFGANNLTEAGNWVAYIDHLLFESQHLLYKAYDPEGLLSTIPSIATTVLGFLTGSLLLSAQTDARKVGTMLSLGLIFLGLSSFWNLSFPINKNIWTSSFVLWSGAYALIVFGLCYFIIDILKYKKWTLPLRIFGMNALFIFVLHVFLLKIQAMFHFCLKNGKEDNLRCVITDYLFGGFTSQNAGLFYALCFVFLNFLVALFLYKRKIFIRL